MTRPATQSDLSTPTSTLDVSVVLPCLNEREGVAACIEEARAAIATAGLTGEVVVVDNGSTDGSPDLAAAAGARVILESERGYGAAYLRGFAEAKGRCVVMADADGTYPLVDLPKFVAALDEGADLVMGSRFTGKIQRGAMPWANRYIGNPLLSGMLRLFFQTRINDAHCGMRALRRDALERLNLRTTGMELASEMVVSALRAGLRIRELPIDYRPRIGDSKLVRFRDAWRHIRFMLLFSPSWLFQAPGLLLMAVGGLLTAYLANGPRPIFGHVFDFHVVLLASMAVVLGYNLVLFDLLAKAFTVSIGLVPKGLWLGTFLRWFSLERGLLVGSVMLLGGIITTGVVIVGWLSSGGGALQAVRPLAIGGTAAVLGIQTISASFLVDLLAIRHR
jgi:glycosyltransferase involved in cell wall biosynthesis